MATCLENRRSGRIPGSRPSRYIRASDLSRWRSWRPLGESNPYSRCESAVSPATRRRDAGWRHAAGPSAGRRGGSNAPTTHRNQGKHNTQDRRDHWQNHQDQNGAIDHCKRKAEHKCRRQRNASAYKRRIQAKGGRHGQSSSTPSANQPASKDSAPSMAPNWGFGPEWTCTDRGDGRPVCVKSVPAGAARTVQIEKRSPED